MKHLLPALLFICFASRAQQAVPDFTLVNVANGASVSLSQFSSTRAIVVIFTSNECPYDNYYKSRVKQLSEGYTGKVQFLLINSNTEPQESMTQMALHYTDLNIPYLADKDQKVMELFGARKSPETFLLKPIGEKFTVMYSGAIDDNPQLASDTKQNYLKDAIEKLLSSEKIEVSNNRVMGCTIPKK